MRKQEEINSLRIQYKCANVFQKFRDPKTKFLRYKMEIEVPEKTMNNFSRVVKAYMLIPEMDAETKRLSPYIPVIDDGRTLFEFGNHKTVELFEFEFPSDPEDDLYFEEFVGQKFRYLLKTDKILDRTVK